MANVDNLVFAKSLFSVMPSKPPYFLGLTQKYEQWFLHERQSLRIKADKKNHAFSTMAKYMWGLKTPSMANVPENNVQRPDYNRSPLP